MSEDDEDKPDEPDDADAEGMAPDDLERLGEEQLRAALEDQ